MNKHLQRSGKILLVLFLFVAIKTSAQGLASIQPLPSQQIEGLQNEQSLNAVLKRIGEKFNIKFAYDLEAVVGKVVDVELNGDNPEDMLTRLLKPYDLLFEKIDAQHYVIYTGDESTGKTKKPKKKRALDPGQYLSSPKVEVSSTRILEPNEVLQHTISGSVVDEEGEPLPGATVLEKGTTNGTITDANGAFTLVVADQYATLSVSFVGYTPEEIALNGRSQVNVVMYPDVKSLQEIVVVGYGTQKKSDLTGSVSSIKPEEIQDLAMPSLDQAIQGRAAGVFVSRNSGAPGSGAEIFIRGAGSIQGTDPLWIIDGIRTSPGVNFNMNDVESIEILKDASAAAIYGSAAANGVIVVTTKRGQEGTTKVSFNSYAGITSPLGLPDPLNTEQYAEIKNEAFDLAGEPRIQAFADPNNLPGVSTDWLDVMYGNGNIQNYDLSISGGNQTSSFFISGGYFKEEGTHVGSDFERYSLRANSDFSLGDRVKIGESIFLTHSLRDPKNAANNSWIRATPALPVFNPANRFGGFGTVDRQEYQYAGGNPLADELRIDELRKEYRVGGNVYLDVKIIEGLNFRANLGGNFRFQNDREFRDTYLGGGAAPRTVARLSQEYDENLRLLGNGVLTYNKQIQKHKFTILAGYEAIRTDIQRYAAEGAGFIGNLDVINGSDPDARNSTGQDLSDRIVSQFGRINYSYDDKYLFTANVRRDGSSLFSEDERYGVFPSASVGWRIINEEFMEPLTFLSDLKLRASYGILGNSSGLGRYLFQPAYTNATTLYTFGANQNVREGLRPARFANEEIRWEEIETLDIGLDLALLENRLTLTADYYIRNTNDLLLTVGLPPSAGFLQHAWYSRPLDPIVNIGQMQNRGLELAISYRDQLNDDLFFNISANASYNENEVKRLNEDERIVAGRWDGDGNVTVTEVGRPLGSYYGFIVDGIIQSEAELEALNEGAPDGIYTNAGTGPGDFRYRDIGRFDENGEFVPEPDGEITSADRTFIGNPWPKWIFGFNTNIEYKSFDLSLFFQGMAGVDRFNSFKSLTHNLNGDFSMTTDALGRWTPENRNNDQPRIINDDPNRNRSRVSSYFVEDGSFLRLKNVQIGYTIPDGWINGLSRMRVYVSGQNLLTFTAYEGFDPEFDTGNNANKGIDRGGYPQSRIFTAGLQLDF